MVNIVIEPGWLWSAGIVWPVVCAAVVAARFLVRKTTQNPFGWDDWLVIPAWILTCGLGVITLVGVSKEVLGYPAPLGPIKGSLAAHGDKVTMVYKLLYLADLMFIPAITCIKLSCIAFFWRVFRTGYSRVTDVVLYLIVAITLSWGVAFVVVTIFACGKHLDYAWNVPGRDSVCLAISFKWQQALAVSDVIVDLILFVLPLPDIWKLDITKARKIGLSMTFLFGSFSIAASTVRAVVFLEGLGVHCDENYFGAQYIYFFLLEVGFGLIAICLPTLTGAFHLPQVRSFFAGISSLLLCHKQSYDEEVSVQQDRDSSYERSDKDVASSPSIEEYPRDG